MVSRGSGTGRAVYRRRRLAIALVMAAGMALWTAQAVRADAPTAPGRAVVVRSGQTLWGLGAKYAPQVSRRRWIFEVDHLNHLQGPIQAGQSLRLPG